MKYIIGYSDDGIGKSCAQWYSQKKKIPFSAPYGTIAFLTDEGDIAGVVFLNNYNDYNVELHIDAPRCITKQNIKIIYNHIFNELKVGRVTAMPHRKNKKLLRLLNRLGFVYQTTLTRWYGAKKGDDAIVYKFEKENASKWIN